MRWIKLPVFLLLLLDSFIRWLKAPFMSSTERNEAKQKALKKAKKQLKKKQAYNESIDLSISNSIGESKLTEEEQFALGLGDLAYCQAPDIKNKGELFDVLKKQWRMSFAKKNARDRVAYSLRYLWAEGNTKLLIHHTEFVETTKIRDLVAYDTGLFVIQIQRAYALNLIDNEEAWGMLFLNAQRAQDCYQSWEDYFTAYTQGYLCWKAITKNKSPDALNKLRKKVYYNNKEYKVLMNNAKNRSWLKQSLFDDFVVKDSGKL